MPVPCMGSQQSEDQDQSSSQEQQQKRHQKFWKQHQKQPESLCDGSLFQRAKWEHKESMQ